MNTNLLTFLFLTLPLLFHTANADAYDITKILGEHPTFSTFTKYITEAGLAGDIQSRQTVTLLVVENHAMELLSGKPKEVVKKIMSLHVVLDYLDLPKLKALNGNTTTYSTLFQASGQAIGEGGLLKATGSSSSIVFFSGPSGGSGSNVKATVQSSVAERPYFLSVLQVSSLIVPPGIENTPNASAPAHANAPGSSQPAKSPTPAHANAPGSPHQSGAPTPAHANAPGSSHQSGAPTTAHANSPGSPHHSKGPSASGGDDSASSENENSPSSSHSDGPGAATTPASVPSDSGSSAEAPKSSSIALDTVLATRLLILAVLWMM